MSDSRITQAVAEVSAAIELPRPCPVCEGTRRITYGHMYTNLATKKKYVGWETGREIPCGCTLLIPIMGEAS